MRLLQHVMALVGDRIGNVTDAEVVLTHAALRLPDIRSAAELSSSENEVSG